MMRILKPMHPLSSILAQNAYFGTGAAGYKKKQAYTLLYQKEIIFMGSTANIAQRVPSHPHYLAAS